MCGIAGAAGISEVEPEVKKMLRALEHRGPDGYGLHSADNFCLGNTLLKITGDKAQPLLGKGTLVLNGEIYNFRELAAGLKPGAGPEVQSDTEVLFRLIESGISNTRSVIDAVASVLSEVNGDYAFAYRYGRKLLLARDPMGVKPLFYGVRGKKLVFASEKKALLSIEPALKAELIGEEIKPFKPGAVVSFDLDLGTWSSRSIEIRLPEVRISEEKEAVERLTGALEQAVALRLTRKAGIAFSGGIDSVFLAALAKQRDMGVLLYAVGFPGSHDLKQAEYAAEELGMKDSLVTHTLSVEEIEAAIPHVISATESADPMKISIGLPLYIVSKMVKESGRRVLLSGQGADELFGGYSRHEAFLEKGVSVLDREIYSDLENISTINLERDDLVTMANSVELRVPFLDKDVVKTGLAISPELKVVKRNGEYIRKYVLRKAAENFVPQGLARKEKKAMQYGTGVQKVLEKLARDAGFSKKEGSPLEKYLVSIAREHEIPL